MTVSKTEEIAKELFKRNFFEVKSIMEIIADEELQQIVKLWLTLDDSQKEALSNLIHGKQDDLVMRDIMELSNEQLVKLYEILSNSREYAYLMSE